MLWQSIVEGLLLLQHLPIWLGALAVVLVVILFFVASLRAVSKPDVKLLGCVTIIVGLALLPAMLTSAYFAFVLPVVLQNSGATPAAIVGAHFGRIAYAGLMAWMVAILINVVPVWRPIKSAYSTFAQGLIIARLLLDSSFRAAAGLPTISVPFPQFGPLLAYLAIAGALAVIIGAPAWYQERRRKKTAPPVIEEPGKKAPKRPPTFLEIVTGSVAIVAGYLPVFMYLKYVVLSRGP